MNWLEYIVIAGVGVLAGLINTVAAGGSLLSVPLLIFYGLPAPVSNATNRIAILFQNTVTVWGFARRGHLPFREALWLAIPACLGAIYGSQLAIDIDARVFKRILAFVILLSTLMILLRPKFRGTQVRCPPWLLGIVFVLIGVYGGFIQAGVGFLIISSLVFLRGYDLTRTNAIKVFVIFCYTVVSVAMFAHAQLIDWPKAINLALGNMVGGQIGVRLAVSGRERLIRWVFAVAAGLFSVRLFFWE